MEVKELLEDSDNFYQVLEYAKYGSLEDFLLKKNTSSGMKLEENEVREIVKQILQALQYLHENKIVHRDVSLENILVSKVGDRGDIQEVKLTDFC